MIENGVELRVNSKSIGSRTYLIDTDNHIHKQHQHLQLSIIIKCMIINNGQYYDCILEVIEIEIL